MATCLHERIAEFRIGYSQHLAGKLLDTEVFHLWRFGIPSTIVTTFSSMTQSRPSRFEPPYDALYEKRTKKNTLHVSSHVINKLKRNASQKGIGSSECILSSRIASSLLFSRPKWEKKGELHFSVSNRERTKFNEAGVINVRRSFQFFSQYNFENSLFCDRFFDERISYILEAIPNLALSRVNNHSMWVRFHSHCFETTTRSAIIVSIAFAELCRLKTMANRCMLPVRRCYRKNGRSFETA